MEAEVRLNYAIIFVSDMQRSVAFYRDVMGLPLKFESSEWTEFSTSDATLALHAAREAEQPPNGTGVPAAGACRPGLSVPDLDEFHAHAIGAGAACVQAPKVQFGVRIAQYQDPDGLALSVSQQTPTE